MDNSSRTQNGQGVSSTALRNIEQIAKLALGAKKSGGTASRPQPSRKLTHYMTYLGLKGILADQTAPKDPTAENIAEWREDGTNTSKINQHLTILRDKGLAEWSMIEKEKPNGLVSRLRTGLRIVEVTTRQGENKLAQSADSAALDEIRKQLGGA